MPAAVDCGGGFNSFAAAVFTGCAGASAALVAAGASVLVLVLLLLLLVVVIIITLPLLLPSSSPAPGGAGSGGTTTTTNGTGRTGLGSSSAAGGVVNGTAAIRTIGTIGTGAAGGGGGGGAAAAATGAVVHVHINAEFLFHLRLDLLDHARPTVAAGIIDLKGDCGILVEPAEGLANGCRRSTGASNWEDLTEDDEE